ncbi:MAG: PTS sugar transporter subunit IIA, partial [Candidatus Omnitrophica bacterium]|nr:PTS sugar transporter subunit IIA [Candidatus Omnitrophota bacterium]
YKIYGQKEATQDSALIYMLENLVARDKELTSDNLLTELKDIVIQRDKLTEDRFHKMVEDSRVLDIETPLKMEDFFRDVSDILGKELSLPPQDLFRKFIEREKESSTVLRKGLAIPHIVIEGENIFKILLVRARSGIIFTDDKLAHIIFILVGSSGERNLHLKVLAAIAQITQNPDFDKKWFDARNIDELKNIVLLAERRRMT